MTVKPYEAAGVVAPVTVDFLADLGKPARPGSYVANPGQAAFRIRMTLGAETREPMTIPPGVRWLFPSNVDRIEVLPGLDGSAWYQVVVSV